MIRVFIPLIVIIVFVSLYFIHSGVMEPVQNYPVWMKDSANIQTDQTSGLSYVGKIDNKKIFISCDDVGKMHRLTVDESNNPPALSIKEISFSDKIKELFQKFKKTDMEEIFYDKFNDRILLSIEGHEYSSHDPLIYRKKEGIYEITFNNDITSFDTIQTIRRLWFPDEVYAHTFDNIGFEGFTATKDYYFLGLENYQKSGNEFSDSTILYIVNRKTDGLKSIVTGNLKISSICGLYAVDNFNLYGIDRNRMSMFYINFNEDFSVNRVVIREMDLCVPLHKDINKIIGIAPESITFDDEGFIYVSIDPWKDFYKPDLTDKKKLSPDEMKNFSDYVPILYKFKNTLK